ncbi:MAG: hypothetical protein Q9194_007259, partial [Teloschistes cf. exilis]
MTWEERVRKLEKSIRSQEDRQKSFTRLLENYEANATSVNAKRPKTVRKNIKELYAKYTHLSRAFDVYRCRIDKWEKLHDSLYNILSTRNGEISSQDSEPKEALSMIDLSNRIDEIRAYTSKIDKNLLKNIDKIPSHRDTVEKFLSVENLSRRIDRIQTHTSEIEEKLTCSSKAEECLSKKVNQIQSDTDKVKELQRESGFAIKDLKVELGQTASRKDLNSQYMGLSKASNENSHKIWEYMIKEIKERFHRHTMALTAIPRLESRVIELELQNDDKKSQLNIFVKVFKEVEEFCEGTAMGLSKVPKDIVGQILE